MELTTQSLSNLNGVHPDLVKVIKEAARISDMLFIVTEGRRTKERQRELYASGATRTMKSRHIPASNNLGHAVDLAVKVGNTVRWDWPLYAKLSKIVKQAAKNVNVTIEWGGDWKSFKDGPHYQLPWDKYPG